MRYRILRWYSIHIYRNCCYCLATDIIVTSEESEGSSKSANVTVKVVGGSRSIHKNMHVEHSLSQIFCRECGRTYIISHRKNELAAISALVENAKNNTSSENLGHIFNKMNRDKIDFADFPKYIRGCTKFTNIKQAEKNLSIHGSTSYKGILNHILIKNQN